MRALELNTGGVIKLSRRKSNGVQKQILKELTILISPVLERKQNERYGGSFRALVVVDWTRCAVLEEVAGG